MRCCSNVKIYFFTKERKHQEIQGKTEVKLLVTIQQLLIKGSIFYFSKNIFLILLNSYKILLKLANKNKPYENKTILIRSVYGSMF